MDPNANLLEQLQLARRMTAGNDYVDSGDAVRLAELVWSLDQWLSQGGFLPARWNPETMRPNDCTCLDGKCLYCLTRSAERLTDEKT